MLAGGERAAHPLVQGPALLRGVQVLLESGCGDIVLSMFEQRMEGIAIAYV